MSSAVERYLSEAGWRTVGWFDICWLDCDQEGWLLVHDHRAICLCPEHAFVLQSGCWSGDYSGAPLPPASRATHWPWQSVLGTGTPAAA